jgi:iron complex transport system ATP-binding protein
MKVLSVQDLASRYGEQTILQDVSFDVEEGEFFIIIGPNGAGKSSLLKIIAGLATFHGGTVQVVGKPLSDFTARKLAQMIAIVSQQPLMDFPFTVEQTVLMGRAPHLGLFSLEKEEDYRIVRRALRFTEVEHLADRRLHQLSGGEQQRVMIARAICQQPRLILLDEPTAALDPAHQLRIMDLLERLRGSQKTTVVMVSHDLNLAGMYAERLLLLKKGRIVRIGKPVEVLREDLLRACYDCTLHVQISPLTGTPRITLISEKNRAAADSTADRNSYGRV